MSGTRLDFCYKKNQNTLWRSSEEMIFSFVILIVCCFFFPFLWHNHGSSCLLYFILFKSNFLCLLINRFIMSLTTITSRQAASSRKTLHLFTRRDVKFSGENRGGNREKMKKAVCLVYVRDKAEARWELLCSPHVDKRFGSQSVWRQLENSLEPGLIESLSSSLCASWAVGDRSGAHRHTVMRPGGSSRECFKMVQICHTLTLWSGARAVWGGGWCEICRQGILCVYEFLVRALKYFECAELIEYSVYQGCVCVS